MAMNVPPIRLDGNRGVEYVADFYGYCERDNNHEIYPGTEVGSIFGQVMCHRCYQGYKRVYKHE